MKEISLSLARALVDHEAPDLGVEVLLPDDPRRLAVVLGMAAVHAVSGAGWAVEHVRESVSCTLPGVGSTALSLLEQVPTAGPVLAAVVKLLGIERPLVCLAPAAFASGVALVGTWRHELGHIGQLTRGGIPWCAAYALGLVRGPAEAQCYGSDIAFRVAWGGARIDDAEADTLRALEGYRLDADQLATARGILRSHAETLRLGGDPGGILAETEAALVRLGWQS